MKKLNQQGFTHHLLILGIAVVVVAAIGFTGFKVYQKNNGNSAKAYNWSPAYGISTTGVNVYWCKTDLGTSGWRLRAYAKNNTGQNKNWRVNIGSSDTQAISTYTTVLSGSLTAYQTSNSHYTTVSKASAKIVEAVIGSFYGEADYITAISNC